MLVWAHASYVPLPESLGPVRVVTSAGELLATEPGSVLVAGEPPFHLPLPLVPRPALLLSWAPAIVARGRALGWRALELPGPDPRAIARAVQATAELVPVARGTLDPAAGVLWTAGGVERMTAREVEALGPLLARAPDAVPRAALPAAGLRRLVARLGRGHVLSERGRVRFCALASAPVAPTATPARPPAAIGASLVDLDGLRVVHPDRAEPLTPREARIVAALLGAPGVVARSAIAVAAGLRGDTRRLDLVLHRLRRKLAPIPLRTVRGRGIELVRPPGGRPGGDLVEAVLTAVSTAPLVVVTGPCGIGKTHLLERVAADLGVERVDAHCVEPRLVARLLDRRAPGSGVLVLDGVDDGAAVLPAIGAALAHGRRLLLGARAPTGHPDERRIALAPWSADALRALWPDVPEDADGIPLAALDPAAFEDRVASAPAEVLDALRALSVFGSWFDEPDAVAAGSRRHPATLARLGWLVGTGPWRLLHPVRAALRRRWTEADRARQAALAGARTRAALDARPFRLEPLRACHVDLVEAHERTGDPALAVLRADAARELGPWDPAWLTWIARALERAEDPSTRAWLRYFLALGGEDIDVDGLEHAAALVTGEQRLEWRLELAWYLAARGQRARSEQILAAAEVELAALPPDAWLYCRGEVLAVRRARPDDPEGDLRAFSELLGRMDAAQWVRDDFPAGHRRTNAARRQVLERIGGALLRLGREVEAEVALRAALELYPHPDGPASVLIELGTLAASGLRWAQAEAWLRRAEAAAARTAATGWAIRALLVRAWTWALRGEPERGDALLDRARSLSGWTAVLEEQLATTERWRAAARGRPDAVDLPAGDEVAAALAAAAEAVRLHRGGHDPAPALEALRARAASLPRATARDLGTLLAHAGLPGAPAAEAARARG